MDEANKLIGTGKKHLVMGKAVEAVSVLQQACGMLAKTYGDTADECGEAFFWCGKALLELARMENSVLGNALEGVPVEEEEEGDEDKTKDPNIEEKTRDELRVQVYSAMAEKDKEEGKAEEQKGEDAEKKGDAERADDGGEEQKTEENGEKDIKPRAVDEEQKKAEGEAEEKSESDAKPAQNDELKDKKEEDAADETEEAIDGEEEVDGEDAEMEDDGEGDEAAEKESGEDEEEEGDEVGNLQLAWEMLEVAKVIYKRKESKEDQLMAAQVHLKLGEVSAESGNYAQALEDFQECLKLQLKHLDSDSRLLAETHYQLGLAHSLNIQYSEAIAELNCSISVIKSRLEKLQELIDKAEGPEALPEERKEMEELKTLLPEIQEKVEDATEGLKSARASEAVKGIIGESFTSSGFSSETAAQTETSSGVKVNGASTNGHSASTNGHTPAAPVTDISHLVRKKRKPDESPVKEPVVKKVKQDEGQELPAGKENGHTNKMEVESQ
ncbi:histone-binding protein N1/N2 isoform X2 [Cynoglossus semilaevis]|uniref:histone-binding protein N1/N2 isoform X2 n=1 Tax=Cynoglossus semilaevis TaxID=244447 RepID=UPI000496CA4A|nr:histone-binding protein N1/N2 isoform X2 [Cynoglossus semilaevis]